MALTGKGIFIWRVAAIYAGNITRIADEAVRAGFSHVLVKIADGKYKYNVASGRDLGAELIAALRQRGVQVWGWQYVYGANPTLEADVAANLIQSLDLAGFVVNAEGQFKARGMDKVAEQYMQRLRKKHPKLPIALSSYRYPTAHYQFPFDAFLKHCDFSMPQVYWQGSTNSAQQLRKSVSEYAVLRHKRPVFPTAAAYGFGNWIATPDQIKAVVAEAKTLGLPGINFWEWAASLQGDGKLWKTVQELSWSTATLPEPQPTIRSKYIRLKHDKQWMRHPVTGKPVKSRMELPDWNSGFYFDTYPAVVPLWTASAGGDGAYKYTRAWAGFLRASNPTNYTDLERIAAGLFNPRGSDQQSFPPDLTTYDGNTVAEGIGSTGNVYEVVEERSGSVRVKLIDYQSAPPAPDQLNYEDTPWLMNAFTAVAKDGSLHKAVGKDLVFPNLGKPGAGWVTKERVEYFPPLPMAVTVKDWVNIRKGPGLTHQIVGKFVKNDSCVITEYAPRGSNVWGKVAEDRWIAIAHMTKAGLYYYTTWRMETDPPLQLVHPRPYLLKPEPEDEHSDDVLGDANQTIVEKYFAALNKGNASSIQDLYSKDGKLVAEDRKFAGSKAIYNWHLRLLNNKLKGAKFTIEKVVPNGSFYDVRWAAEAKKGKVRNGRHLIRVEPKSPQLINYQYTEFKVT